MQVDVVDFLRRHSGGAQRQLHGARRLGACGAHVDPVVRVAGRAVPGDLGVDARPAPARLPIVLEHHHVGPFPEDEPAPVAAEGARGLLGMVVPSDRGGAHPAEALHHSEGDAGLSPAGQHDRRLAAAHGVQGVADRVGAAGAAVAEDVRRAGEPEADAQLAAHHPDDGGRDGEWIDASDPVSVVAFVLALGEIGGAGAAADHDTNVAADALGRVARKPGVEQRLPRRDDRQRDDAADARQVFGVEVRRRIESRDLGGDLAGQVLRIEERDAPGGARPLAKTAQVRIHSEAEGGDDAETGDDGGHGDRVYHPVPGPATRVPDSDTLLPRSAPRSQSAPRRT